MFKINRNAFNNFLVYILEDSELTLKKSQVRGTPSRFRTARHRGNGFKNNNRIKLFVQKQLQ